MSVSEDTKQHLSVVKKGKPRKFVLLTKGASIVSLVLFKKGAPSKFIKEAKESGAGIPCFGVVSGQGQDIRFQLAIEDGFDKEPVKDLVLRSFLEDHADFKCKAQIQIVPSCAPVLDEDDPLVQRFLKLQTPALVACDAYPDSAATINELCLKIGKQLETESAEEALAEIERLEHLLQSLGSTSPDSGDANVADKQRQAYLALRTKLEPLLAKAQQEQPDKASAFGKVWSFAESQALAGDFAGANKALSGLAPSLVARPTTASGQPQTGPSHSVESKRGDPQADDRKAEFAERCAALEPSLLAAQRADRDKASKLLQVWDYAQQKAAAGDYTTALKALEGLAATIAKVLADAPKTDTERYGIADGIVAERRKELEEFFRVRAEAARKKTDSEVEKLEAPFAETIENSKEFVAAINAQLHEMYDDFRERVEKALVSGGEDDVAAAIDKCREELENDPLIDCLNETGSELGVETGVIDEMIAMFDDAEEKVYELLSDDGEAS